ncbi:MAG TPA: carbohydrate ABC transporter permease [Candidatus Sulfotelmatobacter sp.]|nr:carbohydrate ABC transporter permease [Candidatus Sulfotelmatobacter sp.]
MNTRVADKAKLAAIHVALAAICVVMALPLIWMLLTALKTHQDVFTQPMWWIPIPTHLVDNIQRVFKMVPFGRYFGNSVFVASAITLSDMLFSTLTGFALAKYRFPGRNLVFGFVMATMMIPFIVIMIPEYIIVRKFGWVDSYQALIVPFAISSFGIFMMRQAFLTVSDDLIAAARIDGASDLRILFQIVVPLNVPTLVSLGILRFLGEWDALLWPLVSTTSQKMRTLSLGLALLQDDRYGTDFPTLMAAATMAVLPIILVYAFLQRYFIKSVASFGLKE